MLSCRAFITALLLSDLPVQAEKNSITANIDALDMQQSMFFINGDLMRVKKTGTMILGEER